MIKIATLSPLNMGATEHQNMIVDKSCGANQRGEFCVSTSSNTIFGLWNANQAQQTAMIHCELQKIHNH